MSIRKALRPVKRVTQSARRRLVELPYLWRRPERGSPAWLIRSEIIYGGFVSDVSRRKVSPFDPRAAAELAFGGMTGGDRMLDHGYAAVYARYLRPFLGSHPVTLAEFGILKGTGLAIWCDLFPKARVVGFDIDLTHFENNEASLIRRGAFAQNRPIVHEYDQLVEDSARLAAVLGGGTLDIVIDDGLHSFDAILRTWRSVRAHLSRRFVYFIEDCAGVLDQHRTEFAGFDSSSFGMMTVISAGLDVAAGE